MEFIHFVIDFILHIDVHLAELVAQYGAWVYGILFLILFCETGLVVTPFLPGDSLLFVAGALAALPGNDLNVHLMVSLMAVAAIVGDALNYTIGRLFGERLFRNPNSRIFRRSYLDQTHKFYEKHGGKTIIIARNVPIVQNNLKLLIVAIIVLSILPGVIEIWRHKRAAAKEKRQQG